MNKLFYIVLISTLLLPCDLSANINVNKSHHSKLGYAETPTNVVSEPQVHNGNTTPSIEKARLALAYIHYFETCVYKISKYQSIMVLDNEYNQLYDNMNMKELSGDKDFESFRGKLQATIGGMQLVEEEKAVVNRTLQLSNRGQLWNSLSSALSPTYILTSRNPYEMIFNGVLAASRTYVEYKVSELESQSAELKFMWEYRKKKLQEIKEIQNDLRTWESNIYSKYPQLQNRHQVSQGIYEDYYKILSLKNVGDRIAKLELMKNRGIDVLDEYHYQLGLCYLEKYQQHTKESVGCLEKAKVQFDIYLKRKENTQIFKIDNALGTIALFKLTHMNDINTNAQGAYGLSYFYQQSKAVELIKTVKAHLPYNGIAWLECAMVCYKRFQDCNSAFSILREALLTDKMSDKEALVLFASSIFPKIAGNTSLCESMKRAVNRCQDISINSKICFDISSNKGGTYPKYIHFHDATTKIPFMYPTWDKSFDIKFYSNYSANLDSIRVYKQSFKEGQSEIVEYSMSYKNGKSKKEINEDVDCFKKNNQLMHLFFDKIPNTNIYMVKPKLNYEDISKGTFASMEDFTLSTTDKEEIVEYCKKCSKERGFIHLQQNKEGYPKYLKKNVNYYGKKPNYNPKTKKMLNIPNECNECIVVVYSGLREVVFTYFIDKTNTIKLHSIVKE